MSLFGLLLHRHARRGVDRPHVEGGFTLIELLVTIIAGTLVAAATFTFFASQQRVYEVQTKMIGVQENLWGALETVTRYVRSSGAGMQDCVRGDADGSGSDTGDPPPGGDVAPTTGLRAFRDGVGTFRIPPLWIRNGAAGAPDTITVAFGRGSSGNFRDALLGATVSAGQSTGDVTTMPGQSGRFVAGEFMLLVDEARGDADRGCSLFRITNVIPGSDTLMRATSSPWNPTTDQLALVPFLYQGGTLTSTGGIRNLGELVWVQLAIDQSGAPDVAPRLTLDRLDDTAPAQILAEGIEDMQIAYGCDLGPGTTPDGTITEGTDTATRLADEWTYNQAGDVQPTRCQRPDAIRITLVGRTLVPDETLTLQTTNGRPNVEDGSGGAPDLFRHRTVTATVRLRN
ncbi:MAG TPA: PilW family protein [Polyangia bacterium]